MPFTDLDDADLDTCDRCDAVHAPDAGIYVELRRLPHRTESEGILCADCFASEIADATTLSDREAEVYAYKTHDLSNSRIGELLEDIDRTTVAKYLTRAATKHTKALQTVQLLDPAAITPNAPHEDLTPGTVVKLAAGQEYVPATRPEYDDSTFDHAIIKNVLSRDQNGVPSRLATYVFDPETSTVFTDKQRGIPATIDKSPDQIDQVLVPALTLPRSLDRQRRLQDQ